MKQSPNQIRARKRNALLGRVAGAKGVCSVIISDSTLFSDNERILAAIAYTYLYAIQCEEPSNYISQRYPNERKRCTSSRTNSTQSNPQNV